MAKIKIRQRALTLRKQEMSYSQIKRILGVSKSTLSYWLRDFPLSKERIRELRDRNESRIEKFRETMRLKRERRLTSFYNEEKKKWLPFSKRELFIAGLFLYWGEGSKKVPCQLSLNNTDPKVIKFYLYWLVKILGVPKNEIRAYVHLYKDMNIKKETLFWSLLLKISPDQFVKPYIKESTRSQIDHKGFGHGTCALYVNNVRLKERVMMALKAIADYYSDEAREI